MDEQDQRGFLQRWSCLKEKAREAHSASAEAQSPPPVLPPLETLTPDSDFRPFFHPKVQESLRRAALKKLFADPRFNVMDGLDVYIDDYSRGDPLPAAMLDKLQQAQNILRWAREGEECAAAAEGASPQAQATAPNEEISGGNASAPPPQEGQNS